MRATIGAIAITGVAAVVLAGCTTSGSSDDTSSSGPTVTIAQVNEASSFNFNTPQGNLDTNGLINYMTQPQFFTLTKSFKIVHNDDLGSYKKLSDDPLKVEYTLNDDAKWSDGSAMTADDLMLGWAQNASYYDSATLDDDGKVTSGVQYFAIAGTPINTDIPKVSNNNRTITFTYDKPFVDWELVNPIQFPAKVVASEAGTTVDKMIDAIKNTPKGDVDDPAAANSVLKKVANFVNTGYDATRLPSDKKLLVSGGPLTVTAWTPKQSMTFTKNPNYSGDHEVQFGKLIMRFIGDANAQVTALQNGEVDAIQPQPSADTIKALKAASGVKLYQGAQAAYDHLDLNFASSVFSDPNVRKAFLLTIPRQDIVDSIIKPINPDAKVLDSQLYLNSQDGYDQTVSQNGSSDFSSPDIDQAKTLLAGATPTVKILYNSENPNRVDSFQAIQASAAQAGFKVTDGGSPQWSSLLATGTSGGYDASIFGWVNPGAGNAAIPQLFTKTGGGNYNSYNDSAASKLADDSQYILDEDKLDQTKQQIDKLTFADGYGLPLFQSPGLFATSGKLKGVEYYAGQNGIVWNMWDWTK